MENIGEIILLILAWVGYGFLAANKTNYVDNWFESTKGELLVWFIILSPLIFVLRLIKGIVVSCFIGVHFFSRRHLNDNNNYRGGEGKAEIWL